MSVSDKIMMAAIYLLFCFLFRSNCVVNLSPDKGAVLREAYRVLKVRNADG